MCHLQLQFLVAVNCDVYVYLVYHRIIMKYMAGYIRSVQRVAFPRIYSHSERKTILFTTKFKLSKYPNNTSAIRNKCRCNDSVTTRCKEKSQHK
jgi:hypothetical protein